MTKSEWRGMRNRLDIIDTLRAHYRHNHHTITSVGLGKSINMTSQVAGKLIGELTHCGIVNIRPGLWDISNLDVARLDIERKSILTR